MNQQQESVEDDLLIKYMLGEADMNEQALVAKWIQAHPAHQKRYDEFCQIWEASKRLENVLHADEHAAWNRFNQKLQQRNVEKKRTIALPFPKIWLRAAALVFICISATLAYWIFQQQHPALEQAMSNNQILRHTLADGTVVTLNRHATLYFPKSFNGNTREVRLEGSGFFEVRADQTHPFIVHTGQAKVQVLGTAFDVRATKSKTIVTVESGQVSVAKKNHLVSLGPSEQATVTETEDEPVKEQTKDQLYTYYRTNEFNCDGTPLWRLIDVMQEAYQVDIEFSDPKLGSLQLTANFKNPTLAQMLTVISETFNIQVEKVGNKYRLK